MSGSGGAAYFEGFVSHFGELDITGQGLEVAAQGSPLVGPIISAPPPSHSKHIASSATHCNNRPICRAACMWTCNARHMLVLCMRRLRC